MKVIETPSYVSDQQDGARCRKAPFMKVIETRD